MSRDYGRRPPDEQVLRDLAGATTRSAGANDEGWVTPMWLGGSDASGHSASLARLVKRGLVDRKPRGGTLRPSYLYRISDAGRAHVTAGDGREVTP